jgi:hypothetical protein
MKTRILIMLVVCLLVVGAAVASELISIDWYVFGGGGGSVSNGTTEIESTIGQPVVGGVSEGKLVLCSGYWCGSDGIYIAPKYIYLPLVMK